MEATPVKSQTIPIYLASHWHLKREDLEECHLNKMPKFTEREFLNMQKWCEINFFVQVYINIIYYVIQTLHWSTKGISIHPKFRHSWWLQIQRKCCSWVFYPLQNFWKGAIAEPSCRKQEGLFYPEKETEQWIGASLSATNEHLYACAPRWKVNGYSYSPGTCSDETASNSVKHRRYRVRVSIGKPFSFLDMKNYTNTTYSWSYCKDYASNFMHIKHQLYVKLDEDYDGVKHFYPRCPPSPQLMVKFLICNYFWVAKDNSLFFQRIKMRNSSKYIMQLKNLWIMLCQNYQATAK